MKMWPRIKDLSNSLISLRGILTNVSKDYIKNMSNFVNLSPDVIEERKVNVEGMEINCVKAGTGKHPVLLLPGAMGSIWTDFKPQIMDLDKKRFTIICWDAPGYGKSRPPERSFPVDFYRRDASLAKKLMEVLGYREFSLVGWSDGGITALIMASEYAWNVKKLVVVGTNAYIAPEELKVYEGIRNIDSWSKRMRAPYIDTYGEAYFKKITNDWVDGMKNIYEQTNGDICKSDLANITCSTLIVHGQKDIMVLPEHPIYLKEHISDSRIEFFPSGAHNLHLRFPNEFNRLVEKFLTQ